MYSACTVHCTVQVRCIFRMLYGVNRLLCTGPSQFTITTITITITITIYNNNNNNINHNHNPKNNVDNNSTSCIKTPDADNKTFGLVNTNNDYPDARAECNAECQTLKIYYNNKNNSYLNSENNVDNNFESNDHHFLLNFRADYNSALTGSTYSSTKRNV